MYLLFVEAVRFTIAMYVVGLPDYEANQRPSLVFNQPAVRAVLFFSLIGWKVRKPNKTPSHRSHWRRYDRTRFVYSFKTPMFSSQFVKFISTYFLFCIAFTKNLDIHFFLQ